MSDETKRQADALRRSGLDATAHIVELKALSKSQAERIEELEAQVPHPGDGSCDRCGAVPSVDIPTALCPGCLELLTSTESLQAENAELRLDLRDMTDQRDSRQHVLRTVADEQESLSVQNAELREEVAHLSNERSRLGGCIHYRIGDETESAFAERVDACDRCGAGDELRAKLDVVERAEHALRTGWELCEPDDSDTDFTVFGPQSKATTCATLCEALEVLAKS